MKWESDSSLAVETVKQLRLCGHYLYYRMGDRVGRRRILTTLLEHQELLQRELQDILGVQSGSLSEVIIKMEADGVIEKKKCKTDGRGFVLRLTPDGEEKAKYLMEEYNARVEQMMSCFSTEQMEELHGLLGIMLDHWKESEE